MKGGREMTGRRGEKHRKGIGDENGEGKKEENKGAGRESR